MWLTRLAWLAAAGFAVMSISHAQTPPIDDLTNKQIAMFAAEAQFFAALAKQQKDEIDKMKASSPCGEPAK